MKPSTDREGTVEYRMLGRLEVGTDGEVLDLGSRKQREILAILLVHAGEVVSTERLIDLVWGESPPRAATSSIQAYVSRLRKALEPQAGTPVIVTQPPGYLLRIEPESIDARRFEMLVAEGSQELRHGDPAGATALRTALGMWRDRPLSEFAYEEFAQPEIRHLEALRLDALETLASGELAAGRAQEALSLVETALAEDPLRERCRELQMLALYRSGRHAAALHTFRAYRELLAEDLGLDPAPPLRQLEERILLHDPSLAPEPPGETGRARNPYKGLRPFTESDAEEFFGREELVRDLVSALTAGRRVLALVGPSGSGKSSAVRAGLIPHLRATAEDGWAIAVMTPGHRPFEELAAALGPLATDMTFDPGASQDALVGAVRNLAARRRLLVVVDQFEELFSACDHEEAGRFLGFLGRATSGPPSVHLVLTLRADFYGHPLENPDFARVFAPAVVNVLPMDPEELEEAVVQPALRAGIEVEPTLVAELVSETAERPAVLPLLQYALTELFDHRTDTRLTLEEYRQLGGLHGIVSRRAEELYRALDEERRRVCLQVFLRLVRLGEEAKDSRRRALVAELRDLDVDPVALSDVLDAFGRHRLISFDRDPLSGQATVEVAHEALLWEWQRLARWIEQHRIDLRRRASLGAAVREWEASGLDADYLLTGSRLAELDAWSQTTTLQLTERERAFLDAGLERRRREEAEETARAAQERRLERRAKTRLVGLVAAIALLVGGIGYLVIDWLVTRPPDAVLLFDGTGDGGFNDMIAAGFDRGLNGSRLDAEHRVFTAWGRPGAFEEELRRVSEEGVGLIVVGSASMDPGALEAVAADHPDTRYVSVDILGTLPNVSYISFKEEQGSFLAGAAAALESRTGIVGFVGGGDTPLIWKFEAGYEAGARAVRPDVEVLSAYLSRGFGGFGNPPKAARAATELYRRGADVIYHAAGLSGIGVFTVANSLSDELKRHLWAIGVDSDQYRSVRFTVEVDDTLAKAWRRHILTSMVKHLDTAIGTVMADYLQGKFVGGVRRFGLAEGGVALSYSGGFIDDIRPILDALAARIISGEIRVPTVPERRS